MAVEEQNFETAAASNGAQERGADALADGLQGEVARPFAGKEHDSASGHAANGDAGGGVFGELDDLEAVDMTGGTLKHMPETHVHARGDEGTLDSLAMNPDLLADSSHLSASATPDKAREIEVISERIAILHEHLQKSNVIFPRPLLAPCHALPVGGSGALRDPMRTAFTCAGAAWGC